MELEVTPMRCHAPQHRSGHLWKRKPCEGITYLIKGFLCGDGSSMESILSGIEDDPYENVTVLVNRSGHT